MLEKDVICLAIDELGRPNVDEVDVLQLVDSTNSYLLDRTIVEGHARICVSEAQSAGRGRRGNDWQSAPGKNIMMSLSWGFSNWPETITGLGLAVALVVAERLNSDYHLNAKIKWPNDLMAGGGKLGGILVDVSGEAGGACNVVIGLGLNVHQPDWSGDETGYNWQDLHTLGIDLNRSKFVGHIVSDLVAMLRGFGKYGFAPLVERWNRLSSYADMEITVTDKSGKTSGMMQGVNQAGALIILSADGERHVFLDSNASVRLVG